MESDHERGKGGSRDGCASWRAVKARLFQHKQQQNFVFLAFHCFNSFCSFSSKSLAREGESSEEEYSEDEESEERVQETEAAPLSEW